MSNTENEHNELASFTLKDDPATHAIWQKGLDNNQDPYGRCVYLYAAKWANLMEAEFAKGKELKDIVKETDKLANKDYGITGFMYGCAVSLLAGVWIYGEQLRQWHNLDTQIGNEGERANKKEGAVLNPALLSFGAKKE